MGTIPSFLELHYTMIYSISATICSSRAGLLSFFQFTTSSMIKKSCLEILDTIELALKMSYLARVSLDLGL